MPLFGRKTPRVLVIGLDCASPQLVFEQFRPELPTLRRLMDGGTWGILRSSIPCITVPAWASMLSSRDPGVLGIYGFRNRADYTYHTMTTADAIAIQVRRVWDVIGNAGKTSLVVGVPQTYPVQPLDGHLISDFLTPGRESAFTYPAIFRTEVLSAFPDYDFDVRSFRTVERDALLQQLHALTDVQYRAFEHFLTTKPWDFAIHVNIALDRVHHGFWRFHDPQHRLHDPESPLRDAIRDYYRKVDAWIARLLHAVPDDTITLVVSDHGVKRMDGGICINEWLWRNGWLALKTPPPAGTITRFEEADIDWAHTRAWASGGYYGRVFLNVRGREPHGIIDPADIPQVQAALSAQIKAIPDHEGKPLMHTVYVPDAIYQQVNGVAPDLIVYFGDLHWRAIGSLGYGRHWTFENDTGPDDANHAEEGLFIVHDPRRKGRGRTSDHALIDIAPTILHRMGVAVPPEMQGKVMDA
ncbi:MAG: alkaline phosphatase family protein [bacterium]|nr:alkaline phosphatase family protein [bacterium]